MVAGVIFGFVILLIAMGIASLIGIPIGAVFIALIVAYLTALGVVIYRDSWTYRKRHGEFRLSLELDQIGNCSKSCL
jgi:hypothetical protein